MALSGATKAESASPSQRKSWQIVWARARPGPLKGSRPVDCRLASLFPDYPHADLVPGDGPGPAQLSITGSALANDPGPFAWEAYMPPIFVDTDNSNPKAKLYNGSKAGESADKAEAKIQAVVKKIVDKDPNFTTTKVGNPKGYTIRIAITKIEKDHSTTCALSGSIVRYPREVVKSGAKGEHMVNLREWGNHATASGTSEGSLLDCVEAVTESMMKSGVQAMSADYLKR